MPYIPTTAIFSGGGGLAVISDSTLGADTANFDISGISGTYRALLVLLQARSSRVAVGDALSMRFNNDSGANYDYELIWGATTSGNPSMATTYADTQVAGSNLVANSAPAGAASVYEILIPNYAGTTFQKQGFVRASSPEATSGANFWQDILVFNWRNTAAITRVTVFPTTGPNFLTGSRLTILGI